MTLYVLLPLGTAALQSLRVAVFLFGVSSVHTVERMCGKFAALLVNATLLAARGILQTHANLSSWPLAATVEKPHLTLPATNNSWSITILCSRYINTDFDL